LSTNFEFSGKYFGIFSRKTNKHCITMNRIIKVKTTSITLTTRDNAPDNNKLTKPLPGVLERSIFTNKGGEDILNMYTL